MFDWSSYLSGLAVIVALALITWVVSVIKRDVSIVDSLWSILFLGAAIAYASRAEMWSTRTLITVILVAVWALRLAVYLTARNWKQPEDYRYQQIRARNEPYFAFKSVYLVFLLQGLLAWVVSLPLLAATSSATALNLFDFIGIAVIVFGLGFESIGDWQLARFKRDPNNRGKVMSQGLWRYTRHPNYFGECCVWWGFYLLAVGAGAFTWTLIGPALMTFLLLRVSGVALLEKDIGKRRPEYRRYIETTNAFIPGPVRAARE